MKNFGWILCIVGGLILFIPVLQNIMTLNGEQMVLCGIIVVVLSPICFWKTPLYKPLREAVQNHSVAKFALIFILCLPLGYLIAMWLIAHGF